MAGCIVDRNLFTISYDNLSSEIASQHKDWAPHQVRIEAARLFRPSYRQNMESVKQEFANGKEYPGTPFVFEDGKVNFIDGLRTTNILTFHENQLRDTPEKYSLEQHETSLLIQTAFQNGATEVMTSYIEPSGQRDIVVMTLDRATGKGKMRIINTLTDHTMPEMQNIVKKNFSHLYEVHPTTNAFIFSDTHISKEQIQQKFTMIDLQGHAVIKETVGAAKNTVREIRCTTDSVRQFVQRSNDERLNVHPDVIGESFIHPVQRMFEDKKDGSPIFQHHPDHNKGVEKVRVKKHDINLLGRSLERLKQTRRQVQEKIVTSIATLLFVRATGVGIGGVFESIQTIIRAPKISFESVKRTREEKQKRNRRRTEVALKRKRTSEKITVVRLRERDSALTRKEHRPIRRKGKMRSFQMREGFNRLTKKEQRALRRNEKVLRIKEKRLVLCKERRRMRRKEILLRRKEKKLSYRKEQRTMRVKEKQLWMILKRLVQKTVSGEKKRVERRSLFMKIKQKEKSEKIYVMKKEKQTAKTRIEHHTKRQEKQHVIDFSVALVIWLFLHMQTPSHLKEKRHEVSLIRRETSKKLIVKEPAPWLLFAIIWHLAMIREGGMRTVYKQKKAKKQIKQYYPASIPQQGVIFAFAS